MSKLPEDASHMQFARRYRVNCNKAVSGKQNDERARAITRWFMVYSNHPNPWGVYDKLKVSPITGWQFARRVMTDLSSQSADVDVKQ